MSCVYCSSDPRRASEIASSLKRMSGGFSQNQRNTGGHRPPLQSTWSRAASFATPVAEEGNALNACRTSVNGVPTYGIHLIGPVGMDRNGQGLVYVFTLIHCCT